MNNALLNRPSTCPDDADDDHLITIPIDAGNSNIKSNNKMQSVNVTSSTIVSINYKGNDNCLLFECKTAVTVPNTKPQRNTDGSSRAPNNNSDKLDVVNVYDKKYGALNRSSTEPQSQCRLNQIPGDDIPACDAAAMPPHPQKSEYLKSGNDNDKDDKSYNDIDTSTQINIQQQTNKPSDYDYDYDYDTYITFDRLIALCKHTDMLVRKGLCPPRRLGLYGGGESSLSTGTSGWGTPPSTNTNNNNGKYSI